MSISSLIVVVFLIQSLSSLLRKQTNQLILHQFWWVKISKLLEMKTQSNQACHTYYYLLRMKEEEIGIMGEETWYNNPTSCLPWPKPNQTSILTLPPSIFSIYIKHFETLIQESMINIANFFKENLEGKSIFLVNAEKDDNYEDGNLAFFSSFFLRWDDS